MEKQREELNTLVFSYLTLRKAIGLLGVALPFTVALGALIFFQTGLKGSVSSYYYTGMRDVFVGILWAMGFFLLSYRGYERVDNIASNAASVCAVGIALFPTGPDVESSAAPSCVTLPDWTGLLHVAFAAGFFLILTYFSLFLFTKTHADRKPTPEKLQRNRVYRVCGSVMAACILLAAIYVIVPDKSAFERYHPVFWLEAIVTIAFGVSWLTKGEAILKDRVAIETTPVVAQIST